MSAAFSFRPILTWLAVGAGAGLLVFLYAFQPVNPVNTTPTTSASTLPAKDLPPGLETATLASGCFWCAQAVLERVDGIKQVVCGYMGGHVANPTYEEVCTETTGHAECVQVKFDPKVITYEQLLEWFWRMHDPTTLNRQGNDVGESYRSVIFYANDAQKAAAEKSMAAAQKDFSDPIVTQIVPATTFYPAEDYHQQYFDKNPSQGYCYFVIAPKLEKLHIADKPPTAAGSN